MTNCGALAVEHTSLMGNTDETSGKGVWGDQVFWKVKHSGRIDKTKILSKGKRRGKGRGGEV